MLLELYGFYRQVGSDNILLFALLSFFLYRLLGGRWPWLNGLVYTLLSTATYSIGYLSLMNQAFFTMTDTGQYWYFFLCVMTFSLLWSQLCLNGNLFVKCVYTLYYLSFVLLYKVICALLYTNEALMPAKRYAILDILTAAALYVFLGALTVLFQRTVAFREQSYPLRLRFGLLFFPASLLISFFALYAFALPLTIYAAPVLSGLIMLNLPIIYILTTAIGRFYEERRQMDDALARSRAQLDGYRTSAAAQEQLRRERHELKNKYFYLQTLLREGRNGQAQTYLEQEVGKLEEIGGGVQTGNTLLDYLLNRKLGRARDQKIKIYTEITLPKQLSVNENDLCTILANLLDNAIEASTRETDRDIQLVLKCVQGHFVCRVSNKVGFDVLAENPEFCTTKAEKGKHGIGIKIVRSTVEKAGGLILFNMKGGYFTADVMLPISCSDGVVDMRI